MVSTIVNDLQTPFQPSNLTALERYKILAPILSESTESVLRLVLEPQTAARDSDVRSNLDRMFTDAARGTDMSVEEVRRAFQGFSTLGMAGLMSPIPLDAGRVAKSFQGTWEMRHRFTNGGRTPSSGERGHTKARSNMYYELVDAEQNKVSQLTVMWTEENHYLREDAVKRLMSDRSESDQTFLIASFARIQLKQIDPYTVEYTDEAEIIGNFGDYHAAPRMRSRAIMMRFGGSESLLGIPETRFVRPDGTEEPVTGTFLLLNAHGCGPAAFSWIMSGLPPMVGDERSLDTVDTYIKQNDDPPLVGGWEPIESYFNRLRDPGGFADRSRQTANRLGTPPHGFYPSGLEALRRYQRNYDY